MMNEKGQVGLDTAKVVLMAIFVLGMIGFTILIMFGSLKGTQVSKESGAVTIFNETTGQPLNSTGYTVDGATDPDFNSFVVSEVRNVTSGTALDSSNYSTSGALIVGVGGVNWNVVEADYSYKYNQFTGISTNISQGTTSFFGNVTTWFSLLAIIVIILIIAIVIFAVNRFTNRGGGGSL